MLLEEVHDFLCMMRRWWACGKLKYWCHAARPASDPFQEIGCFQDCDQAAHSCTRFWLFRGLPAETCVELESCLSTASWGCELLRQHEMTREASNQKEKGTAATCVRKPNWTITHAQDDSKDNFVTSTKIQHASSKLSYPKWI